MDNRLIYLDNNATTAVAPEVSEAMKPYFCERYGNPSSIHRFGGSVAAAIENARRQVAELLGAAYRDRDGNASEIIFTSCGTEGDNSAINAALAALPERRKIVTTAVVMIFLRSGRALSAALIAALSLSVPQLVKIISVAQLSLSRYVAPSRAAT